MTRLRPVRRRTRKQRELQRRRRAQWKRNKRRWLAAGYLWLNVGGGTWVASVPGRKRYPSDTMWENLKTGRYVSITCTTRTYFGPLRRLHKVRSRREITRLPGIGKVEAL